MTPRSVKPSISTSLLGLALVLQAGSVSSEEVHSGVPSASEQPSDLLSKIVSILGEENGAKELLYSSFNDLPVLKAQLRPMLAALPDNGHGRFRPAVVRSALHRLFVMRHGWFLEGLEPDGHGWSSTSPSQVALLQKIPVAVRELVENLCDQHGFALEDVAVLGATIEHLVHTEATNRLQAIYSTLGLPVHTAKPRSTVQLAIDAYMGSYVLGVDPTTLNRTSMLQLVDGMSEEDMQPSWPETREFASQYVRQEAQLGHLTFAGAAHAVGSIGETYGHWQNKGCVAIKNELMKMEDKDTGRVCLSDFYDAALNKGKWEFTESVAYLRAIGALDDSTSGNPRVIISNYINNPSNCLAASELYSVCCISECEAIRGQIERGLGKPEATPQKLLDVVAQVPSSTVPKRQSFSRLMEHRLKYIASGHRGKVPLFGRLFLQWLHHAYPRECPYPYASGTRESLSQNRWEKENPGMTAFASVEEMQRLVETPTPRSSAPVIYAEWTSEEELVVPANEQSSLMSVLSSVLLV